MDKWVDKGSRSDSTRAPTITRGYSVGGGGGGKKSCAGVIGRLLDRYSGELEQPIRTKRGGTASRQESPAHTACTRASGYGWLLGRGLLEAYEVFSGRSRPK